MIPVGLIGYGYWGPNMARNVQENPDLELQIICDIDESSLRRAKQRYPYVKCTSEIGDLLDDQKIRAIIVATPVSTHFELASKAFHAGKHVLVEKPMVDSVASGIELVKLAKKVNRVLMVDHTFIYSPAVQMLKKIVSSGELGEIMYYDSVRINLGLYQHDINVIWDLAPHDISIMYYLIKDNPRLVSAQGVGFLDDELESVAYVHLSFKNKFMAHFHVNWMAPVKIRQTVIGGRKKMVVFNDMEPTEKVKIYDKGIKVTTQEGIYKTLIQYRTGDIHIPHIDNSEPLRVEIEHFVDCIKYGTVPLTDGKMGLEVVRVLETTQKSIKNDGMPVPLI